ncbi:MAG TPA: helix-turn-helix domain-containing protein [Ktedonobacterales bacterium]|jgi:DNA-binding HxlR family transcriptional regulator
MSTKTDPGATVPAAERHTSGQPDTHENLICPVARTAEIVCGKWTLLIIRDLATGTKRFSELERLLHGISPKTLSERLSTLEAEGVLRRRMYAEVPPKVEYSLTEKGRDLVAVIESMRVFGNHWLMCE